MTRKESPAGNNSYTQAGVLCVLGRDFGIFEERKLVGNLVRKRPACV
jgi:hypothetical protein